MPIDVQKLRLELGSNRDDEERILSVVRKLSPQCPTYYLASQYILRLAREFLNEEMYEHAATLLWGREMFDSRPVSVQIIMQGMRESSRMIYLGAGSQGKTYSVAGWMLLDWLRDPRYTSCKVISTTAGHAKSGVFSTLGRFFDNAIITLPGVHIDGFIGLKSKDRFSGLERVSIRTGDNGSGALQGFHPIPRQMPHPSLGWITRLRALIDEAEEVPIGVWTGLDNLLTTVSGKEVIKIAALTNPRRVTSILSMKAEPRDGWNKVQPDIDFAWTSKEGWDVYRLDGAMTENVREKREVFKGFMTYEGYRILQLKNDGDSPEFWTFARGMYPLRGVETSMVPIHLLDDSKGTLIFPQFTIPVGGLDPAFEGDDEMVLFNGRFGRATGFRPHQAGDIIMFDQPRWCLQADQWFALPKLKSVAQAKQVKHYCDELGINPEWLTTDRTGNATGLFDIMRETWNAGTRGITFGSNATERRILTESMEAPNEIYETIETEMYAALRAWLEYGFIKFGPHVDTSTLFREISTRKYRLGRKGPTGKPMIRLEPKPEARRRLGKSPDRADALVLMLHGARMNGEEKASALGQQRRVVNAADLMHDIDKIKFVNFNRDED